MSDGQGDDDFENLVQVVLAVLAVPFKGESWIRHRLAAVIRRPAAGRVTRAAGLALAWLLYFLAIALYMAFAIPLVVGALAFGAALIAPVFLLVVVVTAVERRLDTPSV